ncbi:MAG: HAMP domain-containing sensor histidine kinase [Polaromonas sp.]|uniref:sensor histidine kinase n=1 Tax=Polaromonas sp. TaxID=1869339 RepID=UPI00326696B0
MDHLSATRPGTQRSPDISREEWVEMRLIHTFMRYAQPGLHSAVVLLVSMVVILYRHVDPFSLFLWAAAVAAVTLGRYRVIWIYQRSLIGVSGPALRAFMARYTWTWAASAMMWGASMWVYFLKAPVYDQFLGMVVLVGMAGFAVGTFSSWLPCFKSYVDGLGLSVLVVMVYNLLVDNGLAATFNSSGLLVLFAIYWLVIRVSGQRLHYVQRAYLELQYDNSELIRSLTEKSRAALEAVEIKNRFIASAAHDLRQPVHALDLYAGWLVAEPEFVAQIAPKIVRSTKAVNDLFNSLFDLAGLESNPLRVNWQTVDLAGLLQDLEAQYAPFARERSLRFRIRAATGQVRSDPVLLQRLVGNLLSNALRNTHRGGVLLAVRTRGGVRRIEIWDTGVGIAKEHQQAIFQEFYRIPLQGTEEGFGLGLAIVSRLSEAMGHPVGLASRSGRGSVFWVELREPGR